MKELTDAECDAFRRLPLPFNGMVRAIYAAGADVMATKYEERCRTLADRFTRLLAQTEALRSAMPVDDDALFDRALGLRLIIDEELRRLQAVMEAKTHWENCEKEHASCAAYRRITAALESLP